MENSENLSESASLACVKSGFQNTKVAQLNGEFFRMRRANDYGWSAVGAMEEYGKAVGGYSGGRYYDITLIGPPLRFVETKYYATLLTEENVLSFGKQLHKDLLTIFKRIIDDQIDPEIAFKTFIYEFRKSSKLKSQNDLMRELKEMFSISPWKEYEIDGVKLATIKIQIDIEFQKLSNLEISVFDNLLEFLSDSDNFKLIE